MRLAIFIDQLFWRDGSVLSTDGSYALFFKKFVELNIEIVFVGREAPEPGRASLILDHPNISFCAIPYYPSLYQIWRSGPNLYMKIRRMVLEFAPHWDAILIHGPNPVGQMIAWRCESLGVPAIPVLRQNLVKMMDVHRGAKRILATSTARFLDQDFKRLSRRRSTLAVGMEMTEAYSHVSERVYNFMPCLIDDASFHSFAALSGGGDRTRLVCVGRLSREKGHKYLFDAMALLKSRGMVCHLDIVGSGPLEEELKRAAVEMGLATQINFHGFVGFGPALFDLYRQAGVMVLPSITEGLPQVINESLAMGLPTIATSVGGIPAFLKDGETALLIGPRDVTALAGAIERLVLDGELCCRLSSNGRRLMERNTLEANRDIVMNVIRDELYDGRAAVPLGA